MLPSHTTHINRKENLSRLVSAQGPRKRAVIVGIAGRKQNPSQRIFTQQRLKRVGVEGQATAAEGWEKVDLGVWCAAVTDVREGGEQRKAQCSTSRVVMASLCGVSSKPSQLCSLRSSIASSVQDSLWKRFCTYRSPITQKLPFSAFALVAFF